jgi:hypothetical protein
LLLLYEDANDNNALRRTCYVKGTRNAGGALQPHLPQGTPEMIDVGRMDALEPLALDQRSDTHEVRPLIFG